MQFTQQGIILSRTAPDVVEAFRRRVVADGGTFEGRSCLQQEVNVLGNFYSIFNIILTPNGYKANKLYALKPVNGDFDIATTRATIATRRKSDSNLEAVATGIPRLNTPFGNSCAENLLELGTRTNLLLRSEEFDNASWTKTNSTVTPNATTSPDGTANADAMFETVTSGQHRVEQAVTKAGSVLHYSFSFRIKPNGRDWIYVSLRNGANIINQWFNITTVTRGGVTDTGSFVYFSANIQSIGNGWVRVELHVTSSTATAITAIIACSTGNLVTADYVGDVTKGFYLWGAQLEQATFGTSYIPTTTAAVARDRDVFTNKTGLSSYFGSQGTIYFKGNILFDSIDKRITLTDGTSTKRIVLTFGSDNKVRIYIENTTGQVDMQSPDVYRSDSEFRAIVTYETNLIRLFVNGILVATDTSASIPTGLDRVTWNDSTTNFYGSFKVLAMSNVAITQAQAIALSTPVSYPAVLKNIINITFNGDPDYYGFGNGVNLDSFFPDYSIYLAKRGVNHVLGGGNGFGALYNAKFNLWSTVFETIDDGTTYYSGHSAGLVGDQIFVQVARYTVSGTDTFVDIGYFTSVDLTTLTSAEELKLSSSWNGFTALPLPTYNRYEAYGKILESVTTPGKYFGPWFEHNGTNHRLNIRKIIPTGIDAFTITNIQVHDSTADYGEPSLVNCGGSNWLLFVRNNGGTEMIRLFSSTDDCETWANVGDTNLGSSSGDCVIDSIFSNGLVHVFYQDRGNGFIMYSKNNTYAQCLTLALNTAVEFEYNAFGDSLNGLGYPSIWEIRDGVFVATWCNETSSTEAHVYYTLLTLGF